MQAADGVFHFFVLFLHVQLPVNISLLCKYKLRDVFSPTYSLKFRKQCLQLKALCWSTLYIEPRPPQADEAEIIIFSMSQKQMTMGNLTISAVFLNGRSWSS
jgi:hypothetical protein